LDAGGFVIKFGPCFELVHQLAEFYLIFESHFLERIIQVARTVDKGDILNQLTFIAGLFGVAS
jgi:hypothetical protein